MAEGGGLTNAGYHLRRASAEVFMRTEVTLAAIIRRSGSKAQLFESGRQVMRVLLGVVAALLRIIGVLVYQNCI